MALPYFPYRKQTIFMAVVTWFVFMCFVIWFDPVFVRDVVLVSSYLPILILLFAALYWTSLSCTGRWKRSLLWTFALVMLVWLRINSLDSFLNILLLGCFTAIIEYYWSLIRTRNSNN